MNTPTTVLQTSNKQNVFEDQISEEPRLEICEQPKSRGFRFRYPCEGPSHGGVPGAGSDKNKKTYPAVKLVNYQGYARIVVQLVTNEENPRLHPHSLVGKQCQNGICTVQCGPKDMISTFPNLGIQHEKRKNVAKILEERYVAAEMQLSSINDGFPQEVQKNIKEEDRNRISNKAQSEAKSIDLSTVRLMFIAYLPDSNGAFTIMLKPVISNPIFDSKAPNAATLKICRMDCNSGSACGGDEIYLLCDKVQKDDIQVRFYQEDQLGNDLWESNAHFNPTDVHRQYAIVFRTPPYLDQGIKQPVHVNVQLKRKSDGEVSEPRQFIYVPNKDDYEMIDRKRRKVTPSYMNHVGGVGAFSFGSNVSNSAQGMFASHGPGAGGFKIREAKPPPIKQEDPQKIPLDPTMLFRINKSIKQEPRSPNSNSGSEFGSRHTSYQSSSPYSARDAGSPMSESSSPPAPSPPREPECVPGTRIPMPHNAKVRGLPGINFSQAVTAAPTGMTSNFKTTQVTNTQSQEYIIIQDQHMQINSFDQAASFTNMPVDNAQFVMDASGHPGPGASPIGDQDSQQSVYSNDGSWASLQDVQTGQFLINAFDQNHNPMQAPSPDIITQAFSQSTTGPGSGSMGLNSLRDPLMPVPIPNVANDLNLNLLAQQVSLTELGIDLFNDIESDAGREDKTPGLRREYDFGASLYDTEITSLSAVVSDTYQRSTIQADNVRSTIQADDIVTDSAGSLAHGMSQMKIKEDIFGSDAPSSQYLATKEPLKARVEEKVNHKPIAENLNAKKLQEKPIHTKKEVVTNQPTRKDLVVSVEEVQRFKIAQSLKVASAIHDFSVTGDIRMLLVLQRQLMICKDENGDTPLHVAVIHDQLDALANLLDVIQTLTQRNEILNTVNKQFQTALHIATLTDNIEAVTDLLRAGANPLIPDRKGNASLHVACRHGNPDILRRLLKARQCMELQIDAPNHIGFGLYHHAVKAKKNNRQCLKLLFETDLCDVNVVDAKSGRTPLHMAVEMDNIVVAGCLISECDAKIELATYDGYTPLHVAAANDCIEIAALLVACGAAADVSTVPPGEEGGETPLDLATSKQMQDLLSGKNILNELNCDRLLQDSQRDVDNLWWSLDAIYQDRLCHLMNTEKTGCDWLALADKLDLACEKSVLKNSENPTFELIKSYSLHHGTSDGLRSALMGIGRYDAVQILNKALNPMNTNTVVANQEIEHLSNEERCDSAIGSLPVM